MNCPKCHGSKVRLNGNRIWWCHKCEMLFDDSGDDGTVVYGDPARQVERKDEFEKRQRERIARQRTAKFTPGLRGGLR